MITRAQAEALLTLAESLEACERLGAYLVVPGRSEIVLNFSPELKDVNVDLDVAEISGTCLRLAVESLLPKQERSEWAPIPPKVDLVNDPDLGVIPAQLQKNLRGE